MYIQVAKKVSNQVDQESIQANVPKGIQVAKKAIKRARRQPRRQEGSQHREDGSNTKYINTSTKIQVTEFCIALKTINN